MGVQPTPALEVAAAATRAHRDRNALLRDDAALLCDDVALLREIVRCSATVACAWCARPRAREVADARRVVTYDAVRFASALDA